MIATGMTVWAPLRHYDDTEIRCKVVLVENGWVWVKLPGADAGIEYVKERRCYPSTKDPMSVHEAQDEQMHEHDRRKATLI